MNFRECDDIRGVNGRVGCPFSDPSVGKRMAPRVKITHPFHLFALVVPRLRCVLSVDDREITLPEP